MNRGYEPLFVCSFVFPVLFLFFCVLFFPLLDMLDFAVCTDAFPHNKKIIMKKDKKHLAYFSL